jgi:hypothetical protein
MIAESPTGQGAPATAGKARAEHRDDDALAGRTKRPGFLDGARPVGKRKSSCWPGRASSRRFKDERPHLFALPRNEARRDGARVP